MIKKVWRGFVKSWLGVFGLLGAGLLPCPDCGRPMILHFWPAAALLAFRNLVKNRKNELTKRGFILEDDE